VRVANQVAGSRSIRSQAYCIRYGQQKEQFPAAGSSRANIHRASTQANPCRIGSFGLRNRAVSKGDRWIITGHKVFLTADSAGAAIHWLTPIGSGTKWDSTTFDGPAQRSRLSSFVGKGAGARVWTFSNSHWAGLELMTTTGWCGGSATRSFRGDGDQSRRVAAQAVGVAQSAYDHAIATRRSGAVSDADYRASGQSDFASPKWPPELRLRGKTISSMRPTKGARTSRLNEASMAEIFAPRAEWCALTRYRYSRCRLSARGSMVEKL